VAARIVAGAREHFMAHGFRGVTMDELARELGMSKKTLYAHFPSKDALLHAVLLDKFRRVEADLALAVQESSSDFSGALRKVLACLQRHTAEVQPPLLRDVRRDAPELFKLVEARRHELIERYFGGLLQEGCKTGLIRQDIPPHLITEILLTATRAIVNPQRLSELDMTPNVAYMAIMSVILEGVMTPAGRIER
jgi:AcrR family transcriptional regulator